MSDRTCKSCEFWSKPGNQVSAVEGLGQCRKNTPVHEYPKAAFPVVGPSEWCGEYQRSPELMRAHVRK